MIEEVYSIIGKEVQKYDVPVIELVEAQTKDPFRILCATIMSARTKDETTAKAATRLFSKVKNVKDMRKIKTDEIEKLIYPVGFYKTKARNLKKMAEMLDADFNGKVPDNIDDLVKLPGVGRKTANLMVSVAFKNDAICVDTHVHKILNRIGYVKTKNPFETEMILRKKLPKRLWSKTNSIFVPFGQYLCRPTSPKCSICPIYKHCRRIGVKSSR